MSYSSTSLGRIIKPIVCLCISGSLVCIFTACGDNSTGNQVAGDGGLVASTLLSQPLQYTLTQRGVFQQGEVVPITLTLKNIGSAPLEENVTAMDPSVSVYKDDTLIWMAFPPGVPVPEYFARLGLNPGVSENFEYTWDQKDNEGNFVAAGNYTIKASFSGNTVTSAVLIQQPQK